MYYSTSAVYAEEEKFVVLYLLINQMNIKEYHKITGTKDIKSTPTLYNVVLRT